MKAIGMCHLTLEGIEVLNHIMTQNQSKFGSSLIIFPVLLFFSLSTVLLKLTLYKIKNTQVMLYC
jgi:hypothetical protein